MSFIYTDHLFGLFDTVDTDLKQDNGEWVASALGQEARHVDQSQAINNLNAIINDKMERGELTPNQG